MTHQRRLLLCAPLLLTVAAGSAAEPQRVNFTRDIRPILSDACYECHGPSAKDRKAELRLDIRAEALAERDGNPAIVAGDPLASALMQRISSTDAEERMPPADAARQLTAEEIRKIRAWIEQGADWENLWSLTPVEQTPLPAVIKTAWPRNGLDYFVLQRLEESGLQPSPEADRATLIRRLTLDLTGLPPTLEEIDAFLGDTNPDAYEKLVKRLLASPHYGERMSLEWLDAARFADTHGYHVDSQREMWRWRDWVINAFNRNMPFDRFTVEQLAGDLLPEPTESSRIASGFNRNHGINFEGGAFAEEFRVEYVVDRVHTTATVFMGLTMKCARCHDHKFDPISQRDYYRFFAFFNSVPERGIDGHKGNAVPLMRFPSADQKARLAELNEVFAQQEKALHAHSEAARASASAWATARRKELLSDKPPEKELAVDTILRTAEQDRTKEQTQNLHDFFLKNIDKTYPDLADARKKAERKRDDFETSISSAMVMRDSSKMRPTYLLERGLFDQHGEEVSAGLPEALPDLPADAPKNRLGLARWLVAADHPLTARVTVNRFWQSIFGTGIVKTAENFGSQGDLPSHPQLLDWLAAQFVQSGWNVKDFHRLLVTSATYRQSSRVAPELLQRDPENRLLARGPRFRLPAETIRDSALATSGLLVGTIGGPSVRPYQPEGLWEEVSFGIKTYGAQEYEQDHGEALYRRSMYTFWKRSCPPPSLATFDAPDREICTVRRERTNTPLQALVLLNDPIYVEAARSLAQRVMREGGDSNSERAAHAFRMVTGRRPTAAESAVLLEELQERLIEFKQNREAATRLLAIGESKADASLEVRELAAWTMVARLILNLDEAITKS
jgi:hypothetical protein